MEIKISGKLETNKIAIVSKQDYEKISKYKWSISNDGYAVSIINRYISMHRYIMGAQEGEIVDHINGNRLDNRRENLRILTSQQNAENKKLSGKKENTKYRGVYFVKKDNKYNAKIYLNGTRYYFGMFNTDIEAAKTIDKFLVHNKLDHISLNFSDKKQEYLLDVCPNTINKEKNQYYGVKKTPNGKYATNIYIKKNVCISAGTKDNSFDAAKLYDKYLIDNNIKNKKLNFPDDYTNDNRNIKMACEIIDDATIKIIINDKYTLIDKEDYDRIKNYSCYLDRKGYVIFTKENKKIKLHRFVVSVTDPKIFVDHIDNNKINNKKSNLRLSNQQLNAQNKKKRINSSSKYLGISKNISSKIWVASIMNNYKKIFYYSNHDEEYAARARDLYILDTLSTTHYKLNFEWSEKDINEWKQILKF